MKRYILFFTTLFLSISSIAQEKRWAVVDLSTVYMRLEPDYESALETQELMGTVVEITGEKGYWREIVSPQPYRAWVTEKGLVEMSEEEISAYRLAPKVIFTDLYGHLYEKPSSDAATICDLVGGNILRATSVKKNNWTQVLLPSGKAGWVPTRQIKKHYGFRSIAKGEGNADSVSDKEIEGIIREAKKLLGVPYLWGGMSSKGVDCSGLVRISFLMNGILLPRNASQQVHCGDRTSLDSLRRGDLVFFGTKATADKPMKVTHVGIYLGDNMIIHSSHKVRINSLNPSDDNYYENSHRLIATIRL